MRIVGVDVAAVAAPFPRPLRFGSNPMTTNTAVVAVLEEADGALGLGYAPTFNFGTGALRSHVADDLAPLLVGAEIDSTTDAVSRMRSATSIAGRLAGTARLAIGILEMALLDLEAQLAALPLHRLWGQETAATRAYASGGWRYLETDQLIQFVQQALVRGFDTVKLQVGRSPEEDAVRLGAVREAVGSGIGLALDANQLIPPATAERWIEALAPFEPVWLEEPVAAHEHALLARLREKAPFPIAGGESETEEQQLQQLLERGALDVIQPDAYRIGLAAMRNLCAQAVGKGVVPAPHMAHEVSAHVMSGVADGGWLEYFDWFDDWWEEPIVPSAGRVTPSTSPGHGLRLKDGWMEKYRL